MIEIHDHWSFHVSAVSGVVASTCAMHEIYISTMCSNKSSTMQKTTFTAVVVFAI